MFEIWNWLLNILSQVVIPDWGALISLLPMVRPVSTGRYGFAS